MTAKEEALRRLRAALRRSAADFRPGQWDVIDASVNRRERLLVVERTGWGKSMIYSVAARLLRQHGRGMTLLVSPLLALMRNQVEAVQALEVRTCSINSANRSQ